jgi:hypothetical protein
MESEGSLLCSQEPAVSPYIDRGESNCISRRSILLSSSHVRPNPPKSSLATQVLYAFLMSPMSAYEFSARDN